MNQKQNLNRFKNLSYEKFKELAASDNLTVYEKIGFPNSYRQGYEQHIFIDILSKVTNLTKRNQRILDIGCGCSELPQMLISKSIENDHDLYLNDSEEMLQMFQAPDLIKKIPGYFPSELNEFINNNLNKFDVIIVYSLFHYIFNEMSYFNFFDMACSLLASGGQLLIGDIPNIDKRNRFFSSETGINFHKKFMNTDQNPEVKYNNIKANEIDDSIIFSILSRYRAAGFETYLLPQGKDLPMANRREDLLIIKN